MDLDVTQTAAAVLPFVTAAAQAYGTMTLEKLRDGAVGSASDVTAEWGRRLLGRLLAKEDNRPALEQAVREVATRPLDQASADTLRLQIHKVLAADPSLHADIARVLADAAAATTVQESSRFRVTQNAASYDNSRQAVIGSGVQNVKFD